jgi:hypothetical protein
MGGVYGGFARGDTLLLFLTRELGELADDRPKPIRTDSLYHTLFFR